MRRFERATLGNLQRIGKGGQGLVFSAPRVRLNLVAEAAYKEYFPEKRASLNVRVLEDMVNYLASLSDPEGRALLARCAWPWALVTHNGIVIGFLMPRIPAHFNFSFTNPSGLVEEKLGQLQYLLNHEGYLAKRRIPLSQRNRYQLLTDLVQSLNLFHSAGISVGDLSPKNVLFSLFPEPRTYFIDCDSMRFRGASALPQVETPGWETCPSIREELATAFSDRYKLGLVALRLFAQDQQTRDLKDLPSAVPRSVRNLIDSSLTDIPSNRPEPASWYAPLVTALTIASNAVPSAASQPQAQAPFQVQSPPPVPIPPKNPPVGVPVQSLGFRVTAFIWGVVIVTVLSVAIVAASNGRRSADPTDEESAQASLEQARRNDQLQRIARDRVEQGILGDWPFQWSFSHNAAALPAILSIARNGAGFKATLRTGEIEEPLGAELLPDNQLHLINTRQYGKLVQPGYYYDGDFSEEAWVDLSADGRSLLVRFNGNRGGRSLILSRNDAVAAANSPQAPTTGLGTNAGDSGSDSAPGDAAGTNSSEADVAQADLTRRTQSHWANAETAVETDSEGAYVEAGEELSMTLAEIRQYEERYGTRVEISALRAASRDRFARVIAKCEADNNGNRLAGLAVVPCPTSIR